MKAGRSPAISEQPLNFGPEQLGTAPARAMLLSSGRHFREPHQGEPDETIQSE
jgi:hypothetical protein